MALALLIIAFAIAYGGNDIPQDVLDAAKNVVWYFIIFDVLFILALFSKRKDW